LLKALRMLARMACLRMALTSCCLVLLAGCMSQCSAGATAPVQGSHIDISSSPHRKVM
jgi:hypothetical protein